MRVVIAAGGTGGHMYPAIAYAKEFQRQDPTGTIVFIGTGKSLEHTILQQEGFQTASIRIEGLIGRRLLDKIRSLLLLPGAVGQALGILRSHRPDLVIGTGGYFSPPVVVAAWLLRIPRILLEPNAMPGLANRLLGPLANKVLVAFEEAKKFFSSSTVSVIGTPIRKDFILTHQPELPQRFSRLLVFGGSQGARAINTAMLEALGESQLMRDELTIIHQTGEDDVSRVQQAYESLAVKATVHPFIFNMAEELRKADFVICRAGASTLAELTALGKAALLVPFAHATHNHQEKNARVLEKAGAAKVLIQSELGGTRLMHEVEALMKDISELQKMSANSWSLRTVNATETMVRECLELVPGSSGE